MMATHVGFRAVHADFTSSRGFRWPFPGHTAVAPGPLLPHRGACPQALGDGICVAKTFLGAASGGIAAITCLVIKWSDKDVLGEDEDKVRVSRCRVVEVIDLPLLLRAGQAPQVHADLMGANLTSANLTYANLTYADLTGANLRNANLTYAKLTGADLTGANLTYATGAKLPAKWRIRAQGLVVLK